MIEFILDDLLRTDSFKTPEREKLWRYLWYARRFMEENLPLLGNATGRRAEPRSEHDYDRNGQGADRAFGCANLRQARRSVRRLPAGQRPRPARSI